MSGPTCKKDSELGSLVLIVEWLALSVSNSVTGVTCYVSIELRISPYVLCALTSPSCLHWFPHFPYSFSYPLPFVLLCVLPIPLSLILFHPFFLGNNFEGSRNISHIRFSPSLTIHNPLLLVPMHILHCSFNVPVGFRKPTTTGLFHAAPFSS